MCEHSRCPPNQFEQNAPCFNKLKPQEHQGSRQGEKKDPSHDLDASETLQNPVLPFTGYLLIPSRTETLFLSGVKSFDGLEK